LKNCSVTRAAGSTPGSRPETTLKGSAIAAASNDRARAIQSMAFPTRRTRGSRRFHGSAARCHDPAGVGHRQGAHEQRIDEADNRRRRADADREDEQRDCGEAWSLEQQSHAVSGVVNRVGA
jgi:hypothetical protein